MEGCLINQEFFNSLSPHKKFFFSFEKEADINFSITELNLEYVIRKCDIDLKEAELKVLVENGSDDYMASLYMETEEKNGNKLVNAITTLIDSIIGFFGKMVKFGQDTLDKIKAKIAEKHLTANDFEGSDTMNLSLNMDYQKKLAELEKQMTVGEKIVQMCSNKTHVDESVINGYIEACKRLKENIPNIAVKAVKTGVKVGVVVIAFKNYKTIIDNVLKVTNGAKSRLKTLKGKILPNNVDKQRKVVKEMYGLSKEVSKISTTLITGIMSIFNGLVQSK